MAIITPQTDVYLIKCPLEINDANQLTFANATAQANYFLSLPKINVGDDFTYQRKDGVMRVPALVDDLYGYNYVMYKNEGHKNKWFFAYITGMEYLNDSVTALSLKTDVYQTWMFDLTYKRTFIEREHVNSDGIGEHTVPENIEIGEYIQNGTPVDVKPNKPAFPYGADRTNPLNAIPGYLMITFQVTELVGTTMSQFPYTAFNIYNNMFSGLYLFGTPQAACARKIIKEYDDAGKGDAIVSIFYSPVSFFDYATALSITEGTVYVPANSTSVSTLLSNATSLSMPTALAGYTPKNNKLFTYPFALMRVSNNAGADIEFRYEDFAKNASGKPVPTFTMKGSLGQGSNIKLIPKVYKGMPSSTESVGYGIVGAKYPVLAWKSDYYTNWMTQNGVNIAAGLGSSMAKAGIGIAASAAFANPIGIASGVIGLASSVASTMGQQHAAYVQPDQAKGDTSCADMMFGYDQYGTAQSYTYFYLYQMCIKPEYAAIADHYLSAFGYKVNEVKVPNITGRRNWNFVKTIGCYIEADIPQDDLEEIKSMFDKGITFWHNPSTFMDYSQNNDII